MMNRFVIRLFTLVLIFLFTSVSAWTHPSIIDVNVDSVIRVTNKTDFIKNSKGNTTYIICETIDLKNGKCVVPSNSTLFFMGGSIKNGKLVLDHTLLHGNVRLTSIALSGTCENDELFLNWFNDEITSDYSKNLQALHDIAKVQSIIKLGATKYLINNPVKITKAITISGNSTRSYKDLGEELYGSTLYTTMDNNILIVSSRLVVLDGVNFIGNASDFGAKGVRVGTKSLVKFSWTSSCKVIDCNFLKSHIGLELFHSGISTIENNNFALCNVGIVANHSGDCHYINNYINTCDCKGKIEIKDENVTDLNGVGILFKSGSGNSNIIGGKIEWNNKGIVNYGSTGITILGVQFDYNKSGHIFYYQDVMQHDSGFNANSIVGCRFLGTPGDQHIYIRYMTETRMNVTGNFFTCSGRGAYDNNKDGAVGPNSIFSIYERHLDDKYKNTCSISFGSNSYFNMSKLCQAKPQVNTTNNKDLIKIISSDCNLPVVGYMTVAVSVVTGK